MAELEPTEITTASLERLRLYDDETLLRWYSNLNRWQWSEDLPFTEPEGAKEAILRDKGDAASLDAKQKYNYLMNTIQRIVGTKATYRYHHLHNLGVTEEEFEAWWKNPLHFEMDETAK